MVKIRVFIKNRFRLFCSLLSILTIAESAIIGLPARAAACSPPADYGSVSSSVSLPSATTYRIWTHMAVPDTTNNTYLLEIDGNTCATVGGSSLSPSVWQWTATQSNNAKLDVSLSSGSHTVKLIGNQPNVKVDRVIFTSDLSCTPTGDGTNCNVPSDTQPPTVKLTTPASNTSVQGTVQITATATDNVGVAKVEFYNNTVLIASTANSPYSTQWDSTKVTNGSQLLVAKAYDAAGNIATDSYTVNVQNGDQTAPTAPASLTATAPDYSKVQLSWHASTDNVGVAGYTVLRDGVPLISQVAATSYTDTAVLPNTNYSYQVEAYDAAGNISNPSNTATVHTPAVADTQKPTQPLNLVAAAKGQTQINLSWQASTDNIGVAAYDIYRASAGGTAQKIASSTSTSFGDTGLTASTTYTYYVVARDSAGNTSTQSNTATATTKAKSSKKSIITGTIKANDSGSVLQSAWVVVSNGDHKHIYRANRHGTYTAAQLNAGHYSLHYHAPHYSTLTISLDVNEGAIITKDVTLQKR